MSELTPQEEDFGSVYDYLPDEGHPQDVEEDKCPYCSLRRIHSLIVELEAALAQRDKESIDLLDAIFQTVDPEDGEEIVAEAFPKGGPAWVLAWYQEHPNEEEIRARAAAPKHVCYLCYQPIQPDQESEKWEPGYRHFECPPRAEEGSGT